MRAERGHRSGRAYVVNLAVRCRELQLPGAVTDAAAECVKVAFADGSERVIGMADFAVKSDGQRLHRADAHADAAGVHMIGGFVKVVGRYIEGWNGEIFNGTHQPAGIAVSRKETNPVRDAVIQISRIRYQTVAQVAKVDGSAQIDAGVYLRVNGRAADPKAAHGGVIDDAQAAGGEEAEVQIRCQHGALGIPANHNLAVRGGAKHADSSSRFVLGEVILACDVTDAGVHGPILAVGEKIPQPPGVAAMNRFRPVECLKHGLVRRSAGRSDAQRAEGRVVLEETPAPQHGEFEAGIIDIGAQTVLVPLAAHIAEYRQARSVRVKLLRGGKSGAGLRVAAVSHTEADGR